MTFRAANAQTVEQALTTTWTADTDVAIEKSGPTNPSNYPAAGGETTYKLRYGYQQIDQTNPNKVGIRWNGSSRKGDSLNGLGFVASRTSRLWTRCPPRRSSCLPPTAASTTRRPTP